MILNDPKPRFQNQAVLWRWISPKWLKIRPFLLWKANRKPYPGFQIAPFSVTMSDLWPTFQRHDNIQRQITRLIVSRVWSIEWLRFQWPWVTLNLDFKVTVLLQIPGVLCAQLTRDLFAIAKFLLVSFKKNRYSAANLNQKAHQDIGIYRTIFSRRLEQMQIWRIQLSVNVLDGHEAAPMFPIGLQTSKTGWQDQLNTYAFFGIHWHFVRTKRAKIVATRDVFVSQIGY